MRNLIFPYNKRMVPESIIITGTMKVPF